MKYELLTILSYIKINSQMQEQINNIRQLSNSCDIVSAMEKAILSNILDKTDEFNTFKEMYALLNRSNTEIDNMPSDDLLKYINSLEKYFPNCFDTAYHFYNYIMNPDAAYQFIIMEFKRNTFTLMGILKQFYDRARNYKSHFNFKLKYPKTHIIAHLFNCSIEDSNQGLFNFVTDNEYDQLLIKSCKVRSITLSWSDYYYFRGNWKELAYDVLNSGFPELVSNMRLSTNQTEEIKLLKVILFESQKKAFADMTINDKNNFFTNIFKEMTPDERKKLLLLLVSAV